MTARELKEIYFNIFYSIHLHHGTSDHNLRIAHAAACLELGFAIKGLTLLKHGKVILDIEAENGQSS